MRNLIIKSSIELTTAQKAKLEAGLRKKFKEEITFGYIVDRILGGLVIIDGENMVDASMSTELLKIKKASAEIINEMQSKGNLKSKELTSAIKSRLHDYIISEKPKNSLRSGEVPDLIRAQLSNIITRDLNVNVCGKVITLADGIIQISGLSTCKYGELLIVNKTTFAIAMNLEKDRVGAMLLNNIRDVDYGDIVYTTGKIVEVPVGEELLGRVVNPLGEPIDGIKSLHTEKRRKIESPAPMIIDRAKVDAPLSTGILAIDSMIPIGRGQRELIIGDRQTGKTAIAIDTIINQKGKNVLCVYVAIAQRAGVIAKMIQKLKEHDAMEYTTFVVSTADDSAPLQYLAPYTGCAIAEEFMYSGKDVLIIYDDLSKHAVAYRTISLLLKRPAGREAYPGDVFYIHSRLLERAARLSPEKGGGSMTALPIIETQAGDISSYIPTNVISITDGQIYLEKELFRSGIRPAVNVGLSVSRVGGAAQLSAIRKLSAKLRLDLAHYRELAVFSQFGSDLDASTKRILLQGEKTTEALKQAEYSPMNSLREILYLYLIVHEKLIDIKTSEIALFLDKFYNFYRSSFVLQSKELAEKGELTEKIMQSIDKAIEQFRAYFMLENN